MAYKVSALKWRPNSFEEVIGQNHITKALKNAIQFNRISHAFTFSGPRGVGKTTTARILAKEVNQVDNINSSFDIIEMDAASNRGIDEIRNLRESVNIAPAHGKYKIYIIDEVHMLTKEAFNALLKTLEEPPSYVIFVLATTDPYKMPATILSRTQRYDFRRLSIQDIKKQLVIILKEEKKEYDENGLNLIARKADGSMRDALGYLDQIINYCDDDISLENIKSSLGMVSDEVYLNLFDSIYNAKINKTVELVNNTISEGVSVQEFVSGYNSFLRSLLHKLLRIDDSNDDFIVQWLSENQNITQLDIIRIMEFLIQFELKMKFIEHPDLALELLMIKLCNLDNIVNIKDVMKKIQSTGNTISFSEISSNEIENKKDKPKSKSDCIETEDDDGTYEEDINNNDEDTVSIEEKKIKEDSKAEIDKVSINSKTDDNKENKKLEVHNLVEKENTITKNDIENKKQDIINYIDNKNSKTGGFISDIEFDSINATTIAIKVNNISNFLYDTLKNDIDLIKEGFNKVLNSNHEIVLLRGKEIVKENKVENLQEKDKEHPLFMDVLEKFDGEIKR